jgi:hypothetical protein
MRSIIVITLAALLWSGARAQDLPDATHVADKIGQPVEFQDEVKAVSYSRSTKGYYLSFGQAYPKQALSVWMPAQLYDRLPGNRVLVGRTVRIKGALEQSSTGPLVKLQGREDFHLQQVDEAVLTKPTLDGKQDRSQFQTALCQTLRREDFETLETLGQELQKSRERLNDGSWLSEAFFDAFRHGVATSTGRYAEFDQLLAKWEQAQPASPVVPLLRAGLHVDLAWKWRGEGWASTVTPEGWEGFKKELAMARQLLEANPSSKAWPENLALMQTVALGQSWSRDDYERLFAEAIRIEPDYYEFYCNKAYYLLPRWHGRKGEWEEFAEQERQQHGAGGAGDALYARIALSKQRFYDNLFRESAISWDVTASGLEYLIREHPDSRYLKSYYANLAWKLRDRVRLRKALPAIKDDPDMNVWVNLENVALAEKFASSNGP